MQVRFARHTDRLAEVVGFYRDGLGLPEIGRFEDHNGYDGVFLAVPGTDTHLEFTSGGQHGGPRPHVETLLVLVSVMRRRSKRCATVLFRVVLVARSWSAHVRPA